MNDFSHINKKNNPKMVNVSDKKITKRTATAKASVFLGTEIISHFSNDELKQAHPPPKQVKVLL